MFITFEGIDGCGKTTQLEMLVKVLEKQHSLLVTKEPGGSSIGKKIRAILLDQENHQIVPETELLLYLADRCQHLQEKIKPALEANQVVLCDRYHDATLAYQGGGRQLQLDWLEPIVPVSYTHLTLPTILRV